MDWILTNSQYLYIIVNTLRNSVSNLARLQPVQNTLARVVTQKSRFCRITPVLADLHWLPVFGFLHWLPISGGSRSSSRRGRFFWKGEFQGWFLGHELWCLFVLSAPLRSNGVWLLFSFCLIFYSPFRLRNYLTDFCNIFRKCIFWCSLNQGFNIKHVWIIR